MKQLMVVICFSVLCLVFSASAAEDPAGLSGTWIQDMKASDAAPRPIMNLGAPTNAEGGMGGGFGGGMGGMGGGFGGGMGGGFPGDMGGGFPGSKQGQPAAEPGLLVLQQSESEMQIKNIAKGVGGAADTSIAESYKLDGKEVVEMVPVPNSKPLKQTTKVSLKKNKFQVKKTIATPQGDQEIKRDYSLSKDGKQLTLEIKTTTGMGLTVMQMEQKLIYNRQ